MSKYCPYCGEEQIDAAKFCKNCGKTLKTHNTIRKIQIPINLKKLKKNIKSQ